MWIACIDILLDCDTFIIPTALNDDLTVEFVRNFLRENSFKLSASHQKVCFLIIKRIHEKLKLGKRFSPIKEDTGIIVDGHHRYIALSLLGIEVETDPGTKSFSTLAVKWSNVEVVDIEWEKPSLIAKHNKG
jgi:hypothetical protein